MSSRENAPSAKQNYPCGHTQWKHTRTIITRMHMCLKEKLNKAVSSITHPIVRLPVA